MHGLYEITKNLINLDLIEIIQFWLMDGSFFCHFDFLLKAPQPFTGLFFVILAQKGLKTYLLTYFGIFLNMLPYDHSRAVVSTFQKKTPLLLLLMLAKFL